MKKSKLVPKKEHDAFENEPGAYSDPTEKMSPEAKKIYLDTLERNKKLVGK